MIEILASVAIVGILATLVVGGVSKAKAMAQAAGCAANMRNLGVAINLYASDHNGSLPPEDGLGLWLSANAVSGDDAAQLVYYFQQATGDKTPAGQVVKSFACPAALAAYPNLKKPSDPNSSMAIYSLNRTVGFPGREPFGFFGAVYPAMKLIQVQTEAIKSEDPRKDQRWLVQEADQQGGCTASWDSSMFPVKPVHGNFRHRLGLDGHVERLSLKDSEIE